MIPLLPFYFYFISFALLDVPRKVRYYLEVLLLGIYLLSFSKFESWHIKNDWRDTAEYIKKNWEDKSSYIILKPYWALIPLLYYFPEAKGKIIEKFNDIGKGNLSLWVVLSYGWEKRILDITCFLNKWGYYIKKECFYKGIDIYNFSKMTKFSFKKGEEDGFEKFRRNDEAGSGG